MEHYEKVEKLREKANISYEEARAVLEECDWDLLDAIVKLEADGTVFSNQGTAEDGEPKTALQIAESYQQYQQEQQKKTKGVFRSICDGLKFLLDKGLHNKFIVKRYGEIIMDIPILLLVILMIGFFWFLLILMAVSLFFGFSYSFEGPELGRDDINHVMGKAAEAAENLKTEAKEYHEKEKKNG